jgi:hypothetical protein
VHSRKATAAPPGWRAIQRPASRKHEMGKRVLASDEFELRALRMRFLAVSGQISGQLARLAQRIADAPCAEQSAFSC